MGSWPFTIGPSNRIQTIPSQGDAVGWGVAMVDVDLDGYLDLIVGSKDDGRLVYYRNMNVDSKMTLADAVPLADQNGSPFDFGDQSWPAAIDLDGDNDFDLLVADKEGYIHKIICSNPGSTQGYEYAGKLGTLEQDPVDITHVIGGGAIAPSLTTSDVNADGLVDVVMGDTYGRVWCLQNVGTTNAASFSIKPLAVSGTTAAYMEILDNRDIRLYFALPTIANDTKLRYHNISITGAVLSGEISITSPTTGVESIELEHIPNSIHLMQNYPNPFNPETLISFNLPQDSQVSLKIYDVLGREVKTLLNGNIQRGYHKIVWDARDHDSNLVVNGIYLYRLQTGSFSKVRKMTLLR